MAPKKKLILVVEDHPTNMRLAVDLLELKDYVVLKAENGALAREHWGQSVPDLILMDIGLPDTSGLDLLKEVRLDGRLRRVKVVAFTAMVMQETRDEIEQAGFDAYISKPFDTKEFIRVIQKTLEP